MRKDVDAELLAATIEAFDGVPTLNGLAKAIKVYFGKVEELVSENPHLNKAMEKRGREWLNNSSEKDFLKAYSHGGWKTFLPEYASEIVIKRFSGILLREIRVYDGIPSPEGLSRVIGVSSHTVRAQTSRSPILIEAMEKRGTEWLENMDEKEFLIHIPKKDWGPCLPGYARKIVDKRLSEIILREIGSIEGVPNAFNLSKVIGITRSTVETIIYSDPAVWIAFYQKHGLTPDQAIELAIERNDESKAATAVLERRLPHLHAFREMAGIIRCFGNLLEGRILEISLYPEPLSKAAAELSVQLDVLHVPMRSFRKNEPPELQAANAAVLQGIHRLATEGLTNLVSKIHESLGEGKGVIATFSTKHAHSESFLHALLENGFTLQESGILRIEPPDDATLHLYGVADDDLSRVRDKIKCESRVLVLTTTEARAVIPIPQLEKTTGAEGETVLSPTTKEIDSPPGIVKEICARFLQDPVVLPSAPFIVDVLHEEKLVAVLGYDMDPTRKNSIESAIYPHAPTLDFRKMARTLATRAEERMRLGIKPNAISKVPLERLR